MIPYIRYKIEPCDTGKYSLAWPLAVYETAALPLSYAGLLSIAQSFGVIYQGKFERNAPPLKEGG